MTARPGRDDRAGIWSRRLRRLLVGLLIAFLVLVVLYVAVRPFRVAVLTLALVPELFEGAPRPLSAVTPEPRRVLTEYGADTRDRLDLYIPASSPVELGTPDRYPALLVVLGVNPLPLEDPRVVAFGRALSRLGYVVAVPASSDMAERRLTAEEPAHLVEAFEAVAARREVDRDRIGIAAFSAGGGVALVAATDPRIADRIAFVNVFGSYADLPTLLVEFATRRIVVDGVEQAWQPAQLTREVFLQILLESIDDPADRERVRQPIEPIVLGEDPPRGDAWDPAVAAGLEGDAAAIYRLVTTPDPAVAREAIESMSAERRAELDALSPSIVASRLRTDVYLMHDVGDALIPFSQLAPLEDAVPDDRLRRVTSFSVFDHITPRGVDLAAAGEIWALYRHLLDVLSDGL